MENRGYFMEAGGERFEYIPCLNSEPGHIAALATLSADGSGPHTMTLTADIILASPTDQTNAGRKIREELPDTPGSLGIAISEAIEDAATREDTKY